MVGWATVLPHCKKAMVSLQKHKPYNFKGVKVAHGKSGSASHGSGGRAPSGVEGQSPWSVGQGGAKLP